MPNNLLQKMGEHKGEYMKNRDEEITQVNQIRSMNLFQKRLTDCKCQSIVLLVNDNRKKQMIFFTF